MIKFLLLALVTVMIASNGYALEVNQERAIPIIGPILPSSLVVNEQLISLAEDGTGEPIDLVINSPGGYVSVGFRIITVMEDVKSRGTKIRCFVPGLAASMAFQILLHCDERYALNFSQLLFHRVRVSLGGGLFDGGVVMTGPDALALGRDLLLTDMVIMRDLIRHIRMPHKWLMYHFNKETFHTAENLCASDPRFIRCYDKVDNLIPYVISLETGKAAQKVKAKKGTLIYMTPVSSKRREVTCE